MQYNMLKYRRNEPSPSGCAIKTPLILIPLTIPRLKELPMIKSILHGIFIIILFMCHPCELTVLPRDGLQIKFGKILAVSPDTAKQDMESFDNTFLFPS